MSRLLFALLVSTFVAGCHTDASMKKEIVGTWSWNPRDELPKDQVKADAFPNPVLEAVKFTADGRYVFVRRIPGYDSAVMLHDKPVRVPDEWHEWKGDWDISKGELDVEDADTEWRAERRDKGWVLPRPAPGSEPL